MKNYQMMAEYLFFKKYISEIHPSGIISYVADTYDYWSVIDKIAPSLKEVIENRKPNVLGQAKVVFRPDSGDPVEVICGKNYIDIDLHISTQVQRLQDMIKTDQDKIEYAIETVQDIFESTLKHGEYGGGEWSEIIKIGDKYYTITVIPEWNRHDKRYYYVDGWEESKVEEFIPDTEFMGSVETLWKHFGGTVNEQGFKVLNEKVGLIYGDSITLQRCEEILLRLMRKGFASCNVVFGIGSYTYQYNTRDTFGMAMKATNVVINGESKAIFKDPKTDSGTKKSAKGYLRVEYENDKYVLYDEQTKEQEEQGELAVVFKDGCVYNTASLEAIRNRVDENVLRELI